MRGRVEVQPVRCVSCGLQVIGRGGDLEGWRAVQKLPDVPELTWYCLKDPCQAAYRVALGQAQAAWGGVEPEPPEQEHAEGPQTPPEPPEPSDEPGPEPRPSIYRGELQAYETSDVEQAGYQEAAAPGDGVPFSRFETPASDPEPQPASRYVPQQGEASSKFVRRSGQGKARNE